VLKQPIGPGPTPEQLKPRKLEKDSLPITSGCAALDDHNLTKPLRNHAAPQHAGQPGTARATVVRLRPLPPVRIPMSSLVKFLESFIFASRWIQAPLYLGLIVAQGVYCWLFMVELSHLVHGAFTGSNFTEVEVMLVVLGLIDVVMIANLLIMVIVGGYETFVSRLDLENHPDQPEWLSHVNAGVLKIKLSTAIIGISSIHLLKTFINAENMTEHAIKWQVIIHVVFLVSAVAMAAVDRIMTQTLALQHKSH
jgi:uncharacterized protein (TIGR00645 family)